MVWLRVLSCKKTAYPGFFSRQRLYKFLPVWVPGCPRFRYQREIGRPLKISKIDTLSIYGPCRHSNQTMPRIPHRDNTVLIIQGQMKQYRVPFFTRLGDLLRADGISLRVAYGGLPQKDGRDDEAELPPDLGLNVNA